MSDLGSVVIGLFQDYGYVGVLLLILILSCFYIEMRYICRGFKLSKYSGKADKSEAVANPTISVLVPLLGEDDRFVTEHLPIILSQRDVKYEVVVIYVGDNAEFFADMESLKHQHSNLIFKRIELNPQFPMSVKGALNIGIKSAQYDNIIFTVPEVYPSSQMWLAAMAKGFVCSEVVLGYSAVEQRAGFENTFVRSYRLSQSLEWLTAAIEDRGYRGVRSNIGFRRELYFMAGGFNNLRLNVGLDDLFFQMLIREGNTEVVLSPESVVVERVWGGLNWLTDQYRLYNTSFKLYPKSVKSYVRRERWARFGMFSATIASAFIMPWQFTLLAVVLLLIKWRVQMSVISAMSKRVGQQDISMFIPLYDMLSLVYIAFMAIVMMRKDRRAWR
ncbi:MAG: hypothetical protein SNJ33_04215 [Rikenellaceae bacterium]